MSDQSERASISSVQWKSAIYIYLQVKKFFFAKLEDVGLNED